MTTDATSTGRLLPQTREDIARLIPHQGRMCLWQRVVEWDDNRIRLQAFDHSSADHPLRHRGRLSAIHLCEYGAQALAVHGGLRASLVGGVARPGLLVALRGVMLACERIDDLAGALECEADLLVESPAGWQYRFSIRHTGALLAEGRAAVIVPTG